MSDFELITTQPRLDLFCTSAAQQPVLYLDTEFVRTRTFTPKIGLIQANDGQMVVLVDPLAGLDLNQFWALFTNPNITKVLHSCSEDLEVFKCYAQVMPNPLFDTQVAAAFLGDGPSLGYAALAMNVLDVYIDKGESRTDWIARPLSDSQLEYAAKDVIYLKPLYQDLKARLQQKNLYDYVIQEGELAVAKRDQNKAIDDLYLDIKNSWRLSPTELAVLKPLVTWRLTEAQRRDLALNFVVKETNLLTIAKYRPQSLQQLRQLPGILPQEVRYHGQTILNIVEQAMALAPEQRPAKIIRLVDYPDYKRVSKLLHQIISETAPQIQVPAEAIASKRQVNQLLSWFWKLDDSARQECAKPDLLQGWRNAVVGEQLLAQLTKL